LIKHVSFNQAISNLVKIKGHLEASKQAAMDYYIKELLIKHFSNGNTGKYGYKPNSFKYEASKAKKHGILPQLVLSGKLKDSALKATVRGSTIFFNIPAYGKFQVDMGRDWPEPSKDELQIIKAKFFENLVSYIKTL
jgi:hypothetical protein